jgi:hypothetical protein
MLSCHAIIEEFIAANFGEGEEGRQPHTMRALLHALVRQAKTEQMLEIRSNAERALRQNAQRVRHARVRQLRREMNVKASARSAQQELEFGSDRSD